MQILGVPMILRTYHQCLKAVSAKEIIVATDDKRIEIFCKENNINVIMTSADCKTGTDRVSEVARQIDCDFYINVQGDEPLMNPDDLRLLIERAEQNPSSIINGYCEIRDQSNFFSSSTPKVVFDKNEKLLYMSRAGIPSNKNNQFSFGYRQVCIYSFPKECLKAFGSKDKKTLFEAEEDIEILRFLEMGFDVQMVKMSNFSIPVDNPEDITLVEERLNIEIPD
jgi:3-deoxy-manno-octulosonate cytidylyltransferase (CMP-KDO synthetase)